MLPTIMASHGGKRVVHGRATTISKARRYLALYLSASLCLGNKCVYKADKLVGGFVDYSVQLSAKKNATDLRRQQPSQVKRLSNVSLAFFKET